MKEKREEREGRKGRAGFKEREMWRRERKERTMGGGKGTKRGATSHRTIGEIDKDGNGTEEEKKQGKKVYTWIGKNKTFKRAKGANGI